MKVKFLSCIMVLFLLVGIFCIPVSASNDWESDMDTEFTSKSGDFDGNYVVDNKDVEYLLWHTLFPEDYPISVKGDFDGNKVVDNKDVEYLLWHTLFPEDYPLPA